MLQSDCKIEGEDLRWQAKGDGSGKNLCNGSKEIPIGPLIQQHGMESHDSITSPPGGGSDPADWIRQALQRHEVSLVRYALGITGDLETARDVVQDTFLKLCSQDPASLEGRVAPWLFTVCRRRALDVLRKDHRMTPLSDVVLETQPDTNPPPDQASDTREQTHHALRLLSLLPLNQREVVRLKFQNQLSYEEIAAITSLSVSNVGFLLHTALKTLRSRMAELESGTPNATRP